MPDVVLGVCGSVAAYRACDLARDLMRAGCTVRVCLTDAAQKFVTAAQFEALTGQPCLADTFEEPERGRMAHIDWARKADLVLIAPATANTLNKVANGIGDGMLTTLLLASTCPVVAAPAMNPAMYQHPETQSSLAKLASRGVLFVEPQEGDVACGENGQGKLAANREIVEAVGTVLSRSKLLAGKTLLLTSGPTQEPVDSVRYLTNRSSGKMGVAMARAAKLMGAEVTMVAGPSQAIAPRDVTVVPVQTAQEMLAACRSQVASADWVIGLAAVADYRVDGAAQTKIRRTEDGLVLKLIPNPDIIATLARENLDKRVIAFAAEPGIDPDYIADKLKRKGVAAMAVNDISNPEIGFGSDENELTLHFAGGAVAKSGRRSKLACALWMLEQLAEKL